MPAEWPSGRSGLSHFFFFSSRRRHTRLTCDWSSDVCSSDLCLAPRAPRPAPHEDDDRAPDVGRRRQIRLVNAQRAAAKAHHHAAILRELALLDARIQAKRAQSPQQRGAVARRHIERQLQLSGRAEQQSPDHRSNVCDGPSTNAPSRVDQMSVWTSILPGSSAMTLMEDGRPPRDRSDTVPAVDRKSTRLNSSHMSNSYAVFCLKKKTCAVI